jgi:hypothetical protein
VENRENGDMVFTINIIPNREFYNIIFENQPNIQIISPREIGLQANSTVIDLLQELPDYTKPEKAADTSNSDALDDGFNLFSNL